MPIISRTLTGADPGTTRTAPCSGLCNVTLSLEGFQEFIREASRLSRRLAIRVVPGFGRPVDLLRLLFVESGGAARDPIARVLFLLPRDGGLHVGQRHVMLERKADRTRVWIFASGFAVSGVRGPRDIAGCLNFGGERVRYLKPADLDDCLAALARQADGIVDEGVAGVAAVAARDGETQGIPAMY